MVMAKMHYGNVKMHYGKGKNVLWLPERALALSLQYFG